MSCRGSGLAASTGKGTITSSASLSRFGASVDVTEVGTPSEDLPTGRKPACAFKSKFGFGAMLVLG